MPRLFIHRGLPGSRKTTHANAHGCLAISVEDNYSTVDSQYKWEERIGDTDNKTVAYTWLINILAVTFQAGCDVAIAEVLPQRFLIDHIAAFAKKHNYDVVVYFHDITIENSIKYNTHSVKESVIRDFASVWEPYPNEIRIVV